MRDFGAALALTAALAGCTTISAGADRDGAASVASISFETGPCFGACPVYSVTVDVDGTGRFEGRRFTAVEGERSFRITRAQFERLVAHLEPLRPVSGSRNYSGEACEVTATDLPSAEVTWRNRDSAEQRLNFYYGCDMERNRAIAERLNRVPELLPIGQLIRSGE